MQPRTLRKPLDDDCLLDGELHPSIRLRLSRIREIPLAAMANLRGVERDGGKAFAVWEWVEGRTLEELLPTLDEARRRKLHDDVRLLVERLHGCGIVHGNLHSRNIIIDDHGQVHLTHASPLLHSDEEVDWRAIEEVFGASSRADAASGGEQISVRKVRRRAVFGAIVAAIAGLLITVSIAWYASVHS
jgi:hypothetical protein